MDVRSLEGKVAVVTGAASGIGRATALALARRRADLSLCDLDEEGLAGVGDEIRTLGRRVLTRRVDVARPEEVSEFAAATAAELGPVALLVNNAGIGVGGPFLDVPLEVFRRTIEINLLGVVHGCHSFLPGMIGAGRGGHVVNLASMAGYLATPGMSAYDASKFGVIGFSESLRAELRPHGIGVTAICPGLIATPITRKGLLFGPMATEAARERVVRTFERRGYPPERVAEAILRAVSRDRAVAPVALEAWVAYYLKRFVPGLTRVVTGWASRRTQIDLGASS